MNRPAAFAFLASAILGALIWALSPLLTGQAEPWDADGPIYVIALVAAGLIAGAFIPKSLWAHYLGSVVGQLGYEALFLNIGPLFLLGAVFLLGYSAIFLTAAAAAAYVRKKTKIARDKNAG